MVKRLFRVIKTEISGLHEAAYLLAIFSIMAQLLGLVRDRLLTYFFGAGVELDIYYSAFKIPDLIFVVAGSVVSIAVLIPFLTDKINEGKEKTKEFLNSVFTSFSLVIIFLVVLAYIFMPDILGMIFKNFSADKMSATISLSRLLLIQPIILGITNLFGCITQIHKNFLSYALGPVLYNFGIILGILFLYPYFGLYGIATGVIFGALLQMGIQLPSIISKSMLPKFDFSFSFTVVKKIWWSALLRTATLSFGSIALIFLFAKASEIGDGSISIFTLALNLQSVPLTIVGLSYSVAAFPLLSKFFSEDNKEQFIIAIKNAVRHITFWSLPVIALFIVLRAQIVRVILGGSTKFTWDDTKLTAGVLAIFSISVLAQAINILLIRAYYASKHTYIPLVINAISAVIMVVLSFTFLEIFTTNIELKEFISKLFRIENIFGNEIIALAMGYTFASVFSAVSMWTVLAKKFKGLNSLDLNFSIIKSLLSAIVLGIVSYFFLDIFDEVFSLKTVFGVFMQGFLSGTIGILAFITSLYLMRSRELSETYITLKKKIWKTPVPIIEGTKGVDFNQNI